MNGVYITVCEICDYIDMYIYEEIQRPYWLTIRDKSRTNVSMIILDLFIRNLSYTSIIPISNTISFDYQSRNSCDKMNDGNPISWDAMESIRFPFAIINALGSL